MFRKRGTAETLEEYLKNIPPEKENPITGLSKAAEMVLDGVMEGKHITVVGDYDADGITSSAIMELGLKKLGADPVIRIPKRFSEGYGLNEKIIDEIPEDSLLITVDNGIVAFDAIRKAKEKNITVVLTDHHQPSADGKLPEADVVVDPAALKDPFIGFCGAGIAYRMMKHLIHDKELLSEMLCLATIGTVCDVMPLTGENWHLVRSGLNIMNQNDGPDSITALMEITGAEHLDAKGIGFKLGPAINAPGRLYDSGANLPLKLFTEKKGYRNAMGLAFRLQQENEERKSLVKSMKAEALEYISENGLYGCVPLVIPLPGGKGGLAGIVSGQLAEELGVPVIVLTGKEKLSGSARAAGDFNIKRMLDEPEVSKYLIKYGGHKGAAGLSVRESDLLPFFIACQNSLEATSFEPVEEAVSMDQFYDLEIRATEVPVVLRKLLEYAPFGEGNPAPEFLIRDALLVPNGSEYVSFKGAENYVSEIRTQTFRGVAFNLSEETQREVRKAASGTGRVDLIGTISEHIPWRFRSPYSPYIEYRRPKKKEKPEEYGPQVEFTAICAKEVTGRGRSLESLLNSKI